MKPPTAPRARTLLQWLQGRSRHAGWRLALALGLALVLPASALAEAYVPTDDDVVLERLPRDARRDQARALGRAISAQPDNLDLALRLAQIQIARARVTADPRYLGQAEATLSRWTNARDPLPIVLVLRATLRQSRHDFPGAEADLQAVLRKEPHNAQALLTLAVVQMVTGRPHEGLATCARLRAHGPDAVTEICTASAESLQDHAARAIGRIERVLALRDLAPAWRAWAATVGGETAERMGDAERARTFFAMALAADPGDLYARAAWADFQLEQHRAREVLASIPADTPADALLLRRALAEKQLGTPDLESTVSVLRERLMAANARGDGAHLRELSRIELELANRPRAALDAAVGNWAVQREPADARLLVQAAFAAAEPRAAERVWTWQRATRLEDSRLAALHVAMEH